MFNIGGGELFAILLVALVLLGPQRIPQLVRAAAKGYREFMRVREQVDSTLSELREEIEKDTAPAAELKREAEAIRRIVRPPEGERAVRGIRDEGLGISEEGGAGTSGNLKEDRKENEKLTESADSPSDSSSSLIPNPSSPVPDPASDKEAGS